MEETTERPPRSCELDAHIAESLGVLERAHDLAGSTFDDFLARVLRDPVAAAGYHAARRRCPSKLPIDGHAYRRRTRRWRS